MAAMFPIQGSNEIELVGRTKILDQIWADLRGPRPKLSLVGPAYIGKSVILKALEKRALKSGEYGAVLYWDFTIAPESKTAFYQEFCKRLGQAMKDSPKAAAFADYLDEPEYTALEDLFAEMKDEGHELLFIWDSFDRPLAEVNLPAQLFGELREILNGQHQLVTATRAPLREIARDKEVKGSPLWNLFGDQVPLRVGCFDDTDIEAAVAKTGLTLGSGARTELSNWTGGHPILVLSLLNELIRAGAKEVDNKHVVERAKNFATQQGDSLDMLWHDSTLSKSAKDSYRLLVDKGSVESKEIGSHESASLMARGFIQRDRNSLRCGCSLMREHLKSSTPDAGSMNRLFGSEQDYKTNIRDLLELRLNQFSGKLTDLEMLIRNSLTYLPNHPKFCLIGLTQVEEEALTLILDHELGAGRAFSTTDISYWRKQPKCNSDTKFKELLDAGTVASSTSRAQQLAVVQVLTGCREGLISKTRNVSKDSYALLNAIHEFRNRSEHKDGEEIELGVGVSALLLCIELLGCLSRELG
jgi:hypothetical protein